MTALFDVQPEDITQDKNAWFTPARYIEAARAVMGGIDLDPASCAEANRTVKAARYYTQKDDGLSKKWAGRVWLNPPFGRQNASQTTLRGGGKSGMGLFIGKLLSTYQVGDVSQAVLLTTPKIDTAWFTPLWKYPICFTTHRVVFKRPGREPQNNFFGTVFVYLGPHEQKFIQYFSPFGRIVRTIDTPCQPLYTPRSLWEEAL